MDSEDVIIMCPACSSSNVCVKVDVWAKLNGEGGLHTELPEDKEREWDDNSPALCESCGWHGIARQAIVNPCPDGCLLVNVGKEA
jgi:hypothetical protein